MLTEKMIEAGCKAIIDLRAEAMGSKWPDDFDADEQKTARENIAAALTAALAELPERPVAWQPRYKQSVVDHHRNQEADFWEYAMSVFPTKAAAEDYGLGGHEVRPLYAAPPAPAVVVKPDVGQEVKQNYSCPCIHPSQCDNSCLAPAVALTKLSLSKWSGWDSTNLPWSEAKHKDAVCYAAFGSSWSMEDAEVLIGFIEKTWCIRSALEDSTAPLPQDVITLVIVAREAFDTGDLPTEEQDALDKALESFSARVPYENEPEEDSK